MQEFKANMRHRSRSTPRNNDNVYIPQPDYRNYDPISVDTSDDGSRRRYKGLRESENIKESPGQRRIRKPVVSFIFSASEFSSLKMIS